MRRFLHSLILYLAAILLGFGVCTAVLPALAQLTVTFPPLGSAASIDFVFGYGYQTFMVYIAGLFAAIMGFFMWGNRPLRRATLTLPVWAPFSYGIFYLLMF
jgi:hypothetical protein